MERIPKHIKKLIDWLKRGEILEKAPKVKHHLERMIKFLNNFEHHLEKGLVKLDDSDREAFMDDVDSVIIELRKAHKAILTILNNSGNIHAASEGLKGALVKAWEHSRDTFELAQMEEKVLENELKIIKEAKRDFK